jgi:hypothetical protein
MEFYLKLITMSINYLKIRPPFRLLGGIIGSSAIK